MYSALFRPNSRLWTQCRKVNYYMQCPSYKLRPLSIIITSLIEVVALCVGLALGLMVKNFLCRGTKLFLQAFYEIKKDTW